MSKYIAAIPLSSVSRLSLVEAGGRSMAQVKETLGCQYIINSWFYNMNTGKPVGNLKIDGTVKAKASWNCWGMTWDTTDIHMDVIPDNGGKNYLSGVELLTPGRGPDTPASYSPEYGGARGRSAMMLAGDYLILYCSGDGTADAKTPDAMRDELVELGGRYANTASLRLLGLDSGGSSQCDFDGKKIYSSRRVAGYLAVWTKKAGNTNDTEGKPVSKKIVCLDPGHGPDTVNGSPDGTYKEKEFAWDMYTRISPLLEAHGVHTICTRTEDTNPSLTERANVSNKANAACYVSLHSNAAGNDGWYNASGLEIYTSQGPMTAQRNILASDLVNAFHAAGVSLRSEPIKHQMYTVLAKTDAPACLIEYGFHTSKEDVEKLKDSDYRDKLAEATAKGICTYLGVEWEETEVSELDKAVDKLAAAGLINSPDYWKGGVYSAENVQALLIKWADSI